MKSVLCVLVLVGLAVCHRLDEDANMPEANMRDPNLRTDFAHFLRKYKKGDKSLRSNGEVKKRFKIFAYNVHKIKDHNKKDGSSFRMGVNMFTDKTIREREAYTGLGNLTQLVERSLIPRRRRALAARAALPKAYDHREEGHVTRVTDQGDCGSCWTYGVVYPLEGEVSILSGRRARELSQQEVLSCTYESEADRNGCNGGWYMDGWDYAKKSGHLAFAADEPYLGVDMQCDPDVLERPNGLQGYKVRGYERVPKGDDLALQAASAEHVVAIAVESIGLFFYEEGLFKDEYCEHPAAVDHAVTLVGYSPEAWVVKNSWGEKWGEKGFVRMSRELKSHCGIADYAYFPHVTKDGQEEEE